MPRQGVKCGVKIRGQYIIFLYLKGAPCLVKGLIILFLNYCVSTISLS